MAKVWNWDSYWTVVWYEDGRYRGAMQRTTLDDPDYTAHIDSLKAAGRKISKVQRPRPTNFYFTARPSASAREVEVVATDRPAALRAAATRSASHSGTPTDVQDTNTKIINSL